MNPILDANNESVDISNLFGILPANTLKGLPLGAIGDSPLGEVFLKVGIVGGVALGGDQLTPISALVTTGGTVASGKKHIEFIFSSDFVGNVNGIAYTGVSEAAQIFNAPSGSTFGAIAYTVSAGSIRLISF